MLMHSCASYQPTHYLIPNFTLLTTTTISAVLLLTPYIQFLKILQPLPHLLPMQLSRLFNLCKIHLLKMQIDHFDDED